MKKPTLKDLASATQLSIKHVSRIIRGEDGVDPQTRARVMEIAQSIGYRPNLSARSLVLKRSESIGILTPDLKTPYFSELIISIQESLEERSYFPFVLNTHMSDEAKINRCVERLLDRGIDGLVSIGPLGAAAQQKLRQYRTPMIYVVLDPGIEESNYVGYNDELGGRLAAQHLLELGHRKIAYLAMQWDKTNPTPRVRAFSEYVKSLCPEASLDMLCVAHNFSATEGYLRAKPLISLVHQRRIDAIFCTCDSLAMGVMHRFMEEGIQIPDDVSIMGYDDLDESRFMAPPLTTIAQPAHKLGPLATNLILEMIESGGDDTHHRIFKKPSLVVRGSTRARRADACPIPADTHAF